MLCDNRSTMSEQAAPSWFTADIDRGPDVTVVHCRGRLVAGVPNTLSADVRELIPDTRRIVLDFTDLTRMDSMGLGTIVRVYVSCKSVGCQLELINIGKQVRQMLSVTNLISVFAVVGESNVRMP